MSDGADNFVLELLRTMRADMNAMREQISALDDRMERGFTTLSQGLDTMQTEVRGVSYVATAAVGSALADIDGLGECVTRLEQV